MKKKQMMIYFLIHGKYVRDVLKRSEYRIIWEGTVIRGDAFAYINKKAIEGEIDEDQNNSI